MMLFSENTSGLGSLNSIHRNMYSCTLILVESNCSRFVLENGIAFSELSPSLSFKHSVRPFFSIAITTYLLI